MSTTANVRKRLSAELGLDVTSPRRGSAGVQVKLPDGRSAVWRLAPGDLRWQGELLSEDGHFLEDLPGVPKGLVAETTQGMADRVRALL